MSREYQKALGHALTLAPVVPVMVIERVADAVPLARALVKGGLRVLEITLRTATAMDSIRAIIAEVEGAIVGSGTVLTPEQLRDSYKLGCKFAVSPGATGRLLGAAEDYEIDFLPGGVTASESMALLEWGYAIQKFFPAEPAGGAAYLASLAAPLPQIRFCPTGGITPEKAAAYLKLPNVIAVGGSWMAPRKLVEAQAWAEIEQLAAEAARLKG